MVRRDLKAVVAKMSDQNILSGKPQGLYVVEECSELIKEIVKDQRGKGVKEDQIAEACDVLASTFVYLHQLGVTEDEVRQRILYKYDRALTRYANKEF